MTDLNKKFAEEAKAPELMDADTYHQTLRTLMARGKGYGKTENVAGFLLPDLHIVTETKTGLTETDKIVKVEKLYVIMDLDQYPQELQRGLVVRDIGSNWAGKTIGERELEDPDFKGPGLWTNKQGAFEFDYLKANPSRTDSVYKPNPEAYRVTLETKETIVMPVQWGTFKVEAGGTLAIRERDIAALAEALDAISNGKSSVEDALYAKNDKGQTVAKFDVYGMEPKFLENNYNPVQLKDSTRETQAAFKPKHPGGCKIGRFGHKGV
ncbi:MAG: hypothetical protein ACAH80_05350 [Alphaproteobacteria bacterium]